MQNPTRPPTGRTTLTVDAFGLPVVLVDGQGRVVEANAAYGALMGDAVTGAGGAVSGLLFEGQDLVAAGLAGTLPPSGEAHLMRAGHGPCALVYTCTPQESGGLLVTLCALPACARKAYNTPFNVSFGPSFSSSFSTGDGTAEARALRAETQLRDAIAAMEDGFVIYDADDRFVLSNARYMDLYPGMAHLFVPGTRFEDILRGGLACNAFVLRDDESPETWLIGRLRDHREGVVRREQELGDGRWVAVKERRTAEGGTVGIRTEITDQKRREQTLRNAVEEARLADRVKSEFLANMSHELRTPLNAIIGFSEVMTTELFGPLGDAHYADYALDIHESGRHLLAVIGDILDLSRIEAGELRLDLAPVPLDVVVEAALRMVAPRAADKGLVLRDGIKSGALPHLMVDALRIKQVLLNLLSNAVKFTPAGGTITITAVPRPDGGIEVCVTDSGIGMCEADLAVALTPFGQVQSAFSRRYHGTGLGLPIAARLMEAHGGSLDLTSGRGEGTRACLVFSPASVAAGALGG